MANNSHTVQVMGYVNPSLEGTTINLSCPMGKVLTGTTSMITCMPNGEWEPDPKFICKGEGKCVYHNTIYQRESLMRETHQTMYSAVHLRRLFLVQ